MSTFMSECKKSSIHAVFRTFFAVSKTACPGFEPLCPCQNKKSRLPAAFFVFVWGFHKDSRVSPRETHSSALWRCPSHACPCQRKTLGNRMNTGFPRFSYFSWTGKILLKIPDFPPFSLTFRTKLVSTWCQTQANGKIRIFLRCTFFLTFRPYRRTTKIFPHRLRRVRFVGGVGALL